MLSKEESQLQKKGIENMTVSEIKTWISICDRNELNSEFNKGRRTWKDSKQKAEEQLEKLST